MTSREDIDRIYGELVVRYDLAVGNASPVFVRSVLAGWVRPGTTSGASAWQWVLSLTGGPHSPAFPTIECAVRDLLSSQNIETPECVA